MKNISEYVKDLTQKALADAPSTEPESLEAVLKGRAVELWSDLLGERLWLVGDEEDVQRLGEPRGSVYTAAEARMVCRITDKTIVREVHAWKLEFNGKVQDYRQGAK